VILKNLKTQEVAERTATDRSNFNSILAKSKGKGISSSKGKINFDLSSALLRITFIQQQ
jgi:hypothetical protein